MEPIGAHFKLPLVLNNKKEIAQIGAESCPGHGSGWEKNQNQSLCFPFLTTNPDS